MSTLADYVSINRPDLRSVSLERDLGDSAPLDAYSPPIGAIQLLEAVNAACESGARLRAWSVIGPYGAGKSTFAHLLAAILGPKDAPAYTSALKAVRQVDRFLATQLGRMRRLGLGDGGAILACVTARPEPISQALARALGEGATRYWSRRRGRRPRRGGRLQRGPRALRGAGAAPVGAMVPATGRYAVQGAQVRAGLELWARRTGARLVVEDDGSRLERAARLHAELLGRGCRFVLGPYGSDSTRAVATASPGTVVWNHGAVGGSQLPLGWRDTTRPAKGGRGPRSLGGRRRRRPGAWGFAREVELVGRSRSSEAVLVREGVTAAASRSSVRSASCR